MTPKISIIHPSRSRPEMAIKTAFKWLESAFDSANIQYILSIDSDDPKKDEYDNAPFDLLLVADNKNAIQAINGAAKRAKGEILVVVSDDFSCPPNWDLHILEAVNGKSDWILRIDDTLQNYLITLPIMDRVYYERFGYIYNPDFQHLFSDTFMTCQADLLDKIIDSKLVFPHNHHSRTGLTDDVSRKNDATWKQGEEMFIQHAKNYFGLKPEEITGRITDNKMIHWLKQRGVNLYL